VAGLKTGDATAGLLQSGGVGPVGLLVSDEDDDPPPQAVIMAARVIPTAICKYFVNVMRDHSWNPLNLIGCPLADVRTRTFPIDAIDPNLKLIAPEHYNPA
jgi:hypothetical protein